MNALILAAGRGTRLGFDEGLPKCLTPIGDQILLDRYLHVLESLDVPVTIVVGHNAERIRDHIAKRNSNATLVNNDRFTEGSVVSLAVGLNALQAAGVFQNSNDSLLLLDGDVAFTPSLMQRLAASAAPNALLVDVGTVFTDEQYMAGTNASRVVALRRGPVPGHELQGEWVGFAKLDTSAVADFHASISEQIARGETSGGYEDALARLLVTHHFSAVPTEGAPWVEIDFADDLKRARALFG